MPDALPQFSTWFQDHAQGHADDEMTAAIAEVVQAVSHLGKKGTVTLKLEIAPAGSGTRTVTTSARVSVSAPTPDSEMSIFWVGDGGALHREDPYQQKLLDGAREVNAETGEIRQLSEED